MKSYCVKQKKQTECVSGSEKYGLLLGVPDRDDVK